MGIFAKGSQFPANVEADTPQNRYGGQLTKDSVAGDALGETIGNVNATADSANTTTGEIIKDIEALEERVSSLVSADITDSVLYADSQSGLTDRLVRTGTGGYLYSRTNPTQANHLARKGYVDATVADSLSRTEISGTNWRCHRRGGVAMLTVSGSSEGFVLPVGWRPAGQVWVPLALGNTDHNARLSINPNGTVDYPGSTGAVYGTATYLLAD